jgi:ribosomal-protein-alanine N-acetyltransferase
LDQRFNEHGFITEAVRLVITFAFEKLDLHRVQAAIMPRNTVSARVVEKMGFHYEGLIEFYLKINEKWKDHHIYSITKE